MQAVKKEFEMNTMMKKCLAIAVALAMVLSTGSVFAADGLSDISVSGLNDGAAKVVEPTTGGTVVKTAPAKPGMKASKAGKTVKANDPTIAKGLNYTTDDPNVDVYGVQGLGSDRVEFWTVKVTATGKLWVDAGVRNDGAGPMEVYVTNSNPANGFTYQGYYCSSLSPGNVVNGLAGFDVKAGQTVWICIASDYAGAAIVSPYVIPYSERTLPAGKEMITSGAKGSGNADSAATYKIVPAKSGYIDVYLEAAGVTTATGKVTLMNSSRKVVSDTLSYTQKSSTNYVVFGVKKGQTYYLKVTGCKGIASKYYIYGISYKVTAGKIRANTKKSKSIKLKRKGSAVKTTIAAKGKSGKDWYKIKVTKKRATQVSVNAVNIKSGSVKMTVYYGKKKVGSTTIKKGKKNKITITHSTTYGKAKRGTYYVVISKSARANGQYSIKYVK